MFIDLCFGKIYPPNRGYLNESKKIICNKFKLVINVESSKLKIRIDSDLPDNTDVFVTISRTYLEKGNSSKYSIDYFDEKGKLKKFRESRNIILDNNKWRKDLKKKQLEMSKIGMGFKVASISKDVEVSAVVPLYQTDKKFGKRNANLIGTAVKDPEFRIIEHIIKFKFPISSTKISPSPPSLFAYNLDKGVTYIVSKKTAIMPFYSSSNMDDLGKVRYLFPGDQFNIIEIRNKLKSPWYKVKYYLNKKYAGEGWINSIALLGQKLEYK